jgi:hypothetical protein
MAGQEASHGTLDPFPEIGSGFAADQIATFLKSGLDNLRGEAWVFPAWKERSDLLGNPFKFPELMADVS